MTAKEFLQQYRNADREINAKLDDIHHLRETAVKVTEVLTPDKIQASRENRMEAIVAKIVDMEREVDEKIDQLQEIKKQVESAIVSVPEARCRDVLRLRYINGMTWEKIAVELNFTYQWVCILHGRALKFIRVDSN